MADDRLPVVREMIMARSEEERRAALELLPHQQADFEGIFEAMARLPVTIRLLDPPLRVLPPLDEAEDVRMRERIRSLQGSNPMLGAWVPARTHVARDPGYSARDRARSRGRGEADGRSAARRDHASAGRLRRGCCNYARSPPLPPRKRRSSTSSAR